MLACSSLPLLLCGCVHIFCLTVITIIHPSASVRRALFTSSCGLLYFPCVVVLACFYICVYVCLMARSFRSAHYCPTNTTTAAAALLCCTVVICACASSRCYCLFSVVVLSDRQRALPRTSPQNPIDNGFGVFRVCIYACVCAVHRQPSCPFSSAPICVYLCVPAVYLCIYGVTGCLFVWENNFSRPPQPCHVPSTLLCCLPSPLCTAPFRG